ncbi:hypothetical protein K4L44_08075 [Halosquirtibacter laminarini]|uniref:Uncharacterized protein n=1 Tax=Halosquirtibacter laminarini TaxID=3374600 RepID=A0AC61NJ58_9BACT|nr:hypothetical protein K4L44_08075 [Prolixibacteraceae bacterium]
MTLQETRMRLDEIILIYHDTQNVKDARKFQKLLSTLEHRSFSQEEKLSIEEQLDFLNIEVDNDYKRMNFQAKYWKFSAFLRNKYGLVPKGYYVRTWSLYGICMGACVGIIGGLFYSSVGISLGMVLGYAMGRQREEALQKEGKILF